MQWSLKQKGWQAWLIRTVLLTTLWLGATFVFATEFFLSARGMPIKITWMDALRSSFHDWFPWILLSPLAVILAGRFRFHRTRWRRALIIHVAACCMFAIAYEGLLFLPFRFPPGGGVGIVVTGAAPAGLSGFSTGHDGFSVAIQGPAPALPGFGSSNSEFAGQQGVFSRANILPGPPDSNSAFLFTAASSHPPMIPPASFAVSRSVVSMPSLWSQFLHMAILKTQFTVPIYWCVVCVCWVITYFQEAGEREHRTLELEASLTQANLQTLKMQLQPHFLFNTLNAISSLIHENPKIADDMVGSLSQFLRATLDVSSKNEVPLREELEFVDRYLEIQQARFADRLRIHREVDSSIMDALVPPLILQPLVENALRHGIEPRESGGTIALRALRMGEVLHMEIIDDGEAFSGGQLLRPGNGIGLSNTEARLQALYGDHHQLKLAANQPSGARVTMEIPFHTAPSDIHAQYEHSCSHR